jgi:flavin-binding protein dodecin
VSLLPCTAEKVEVRGQIARLHDHVEVSDLVWKIIEVIGESNESFANAVRNAVEEAGKTVKQMQWFEATSFRENIQEGKVSQFQAVVKIGFKVER